MNDMNDINIIVDDINKTFAINITIKSQKNRQKKLTNNYNTTEKFLCCIKYITM